MYSIFFLFPALLTFFPTKEIASEFTTKIVDHLKKSLSQFEEEVLARPLDMSQPLPEEYTPLLEEILTRLNDLIKAEIELLAMPAEPAEQLRTLMIGWIFDDARRSVSSTSNDWLGQALGKVLEDNIPGFQEKDWASFEELQAATPFLHLNNQKSVWKAYEEHKKSNPLQELLRSLRH